MGSAGLIKGPPKTYRVLEVGGEQVHDLGKPAAGGMKNEITMRNLWHRRFQGVGFGDPKP